MLIRKKALTVTVSVTVRSSVQEQNEEGKHLVLTFLLFDFGSYAHMVSWKV